MGGDTGFWGWKAKGYLGALEEEVTPTFAQSEALGALCKDFLTTEVVNSLPQGW